MTKLFGRHRVRASVYHILAGIFVVSFILWGTGLISDKTSTIIGMMLFITDCLAEMYDPHPTNPGPWFATHFHRFLDGQEDNVELDEETSKTKQEK